MVIKDSVFFFSLLQKDSQKKALICCAKQWTTGFIQSGRNYSSLPEPPFPEENPYFFSKCLTGILV